MSDNGDQNYISNLNFGDNFDLSKLDYKSVDGLGDVSLFDPNNVVGIAPHGVRYEPSEMTQAKPEFRTDDRNLVVLTTNGRTLYYSQKLDKYFVQRGGLFEIRINHGVLNPAEFVRLFVNHTQERLLTSVVKTCEKRQHRTFQKPGIDCILSIEDQSPNPNIEYIMDPVTQKLSVKIFPVPGSEVTYLKLRFNCLNGCRERRQDMQWNLLVSKETSYSSNLQVISRASIDIKAAEKPHSELKREEAQAIKKEMGKAGRGRKRKSDEQTTITYIVEAPVVENAPLEDPGIFQSFCVVGNPTEPGIQPVTEPSEESMLFQVLTQPSGEIFIQQLSDPHPQEVVVSGTACSYAPILVDENTPRDVLEKEYLELTPHLSNGELVEIINAKKSKLSFQNFNTSLH